MSESAPDRGGFNECRNQGRPRREGLERPAKALKGFVRVSLKSGEARSVELPLRGADLAYWNVARQAWTLERGRVELRVGSSSADRDLALRTTIDVVP